MKVNSEMMVGDGVGSGECIQQEQRSTSQLGRIPKEGERILAPTRRPDGTLRKAVRIRPGYTPQDEVAIYKSKGALLKKSAQEELPPGYDPVLDAKPKTKSTKRSERRKEKKQQASRASAEDKGKCPESRNTEETKDLRGSSSDQLVQASEPIVSIASQLSELSVSGTNSTDVTDKSESSKSTTPSLDLDKKIRALKKKIRLAEAQPKGIEQNLKPEQPDKLTKIEVWREELKLLEDKKAAVASSTV